uniref:HAT C-terminal dimerisation domain-containing protein n=1 Tax=Clastoptera arizonana TaxID=38151 RepID=A0A1B6E804_9HEMI
MPDIVEGKGFQRLLATLKSPCEIPVKSKLTEEVIPKVYETFKESVLESLHQMINDISLSVEEWKSLNGEEYLTISIHFQQPDDEHLYTKVLSTLHWSHKYDSSYWTQQIDSLFDEWNLKVDKIKAVVVAMNMNQRSEIITALSLKGLVLIPCLVYTLQEVCLDAVFEQHDVANILHKCRSLLGLINKHSNAYAALRFQEQLLQIDDTSLNADYPKVWISTYTMLEQLLARRSVIGSILENIDSSLYDKDYIHITDSEWLIIEDVINVLEPFKVTIMTLSEERYPLISLLKPLLWQLVSSHLKVSDIDSSHSRIFKNDLSRLLTNRYNQEATINNILQIATTLDPRFKTLPNVVEEAKATLESPIKEMLKNLIEESQCITEQENMNSSVKKSRLSGMELLLGDLCSKKTGMSCKERADLEIIQYQSEATAPLDQCPLSWWHRSETKCPNLARLAAQYNCIPATAIPPSRLPLENQIAFDIKRANLSPEIIDHLLFLNSNYSI